LFALEKRDRLIEFLGEFVSVKRGTFEALGKNFKEVENLVRVPALQ